MNSYQDFIHKSRYARWLPKEGRRENWKETVTRYILAMDNKLADKGIVDEGFFHPTLSEAAEAIEKLEVMPSMRAMMTAGTAFDRDNVAGYNCSYLPIDSVYSFDEAMYILMCGTGVGFSCERQYVTQLPTVGEGDYSLEVPPNVEWEELSTLENNTITVADNKYGWASALRLLIHELYRGNFGVRWDLSLLRPAGAPLVTMGGRSSGPAPLDSLFKFVKEKMQNAQGRKLTSIEAHDIMCKIGEVVVVGGVRRSALISLSNLSDDRMRRAKSGDWWNTDGQRALANNSVAYTEKPDFHSFIKEWYSLYESKSGERGIFNRVSSQKQAARNGRRDPEHDFGTNPCSEIILRPYQFCNLTEAVVRSTDTLDDLRRKVRIAAVLGTIQSAFTDFKYLRGEWKRNCDEERLLGVSLTGIMDHPVLNGTETPLGWSNINHLGVVLEQLKSEVVETNAEWAALLGIPQSTATTAVKPSGTVSQLVDSASGIHARYAPYYIRRVRGDVKDPLTQVMINQGVPHEEDVTNPQNVVFSFPQKAPEGAICTKDMSAMEQLEMWLTYQENWCEHKPSITVSYSDEEFLEIGSFVYQNFDKISGISFLPRNDHVYAQAPYEEITEVQYHKLAASMPDTIDWGMLSVLEEEDNTVGAQTLACSGGVCEIVDIGQKDE